MRVSPQFYCMLQRYQGVSLSEHGQVHHSLCQGVVIENRAEDDLEQEGVGIHNELREELREELLFQFEIDNGQLLEDEEETNLDFRRKTRQLS